MVLASSGPRVDGQEQQRDSAAELNRDRDQREQLSVVAIRNVAGVESSRDEGQCFSESYQTERERILCKGVYLPRDYGRLDLGAQRQHNQAGNVPEKIGVSQRYVRIVSLCHSSRWVTGDRMIPNRYAPGNYSVA